MELVYLWVEDYKNIQQQGFNFSPRFECEYKDGNLTIDEKKDYVNIFPENINITAIVGENGSGKSGIIDYIEQLFLKSNNEKEYIFLLLIDDELKISSSHAIEKVNNNSKYIYNILNSDILTLLTYNSEMPYPHEKRKKLHSNNINNYHTINMQTKNIYKLIANLIQTKNTIVLEKLKFIFNPTEMKVDANNEYKSELIKYIHDNLNEDLSFKKYYTNEFLEKQIVPKKTILIDKIIKAIYEDDGRYDEFLNKKAEQEFNSQKSFYKENWLEDGYSMSNDDIIEELSLQYADQFPLENFVRDTFDKNEVFQWFLTELNLGIYAFFDGNMYEKVELDIFKAFLFYQILKNNLFEKYLIYIIENHFKVYPHIETFDDLIRKNFEDSEIEKVEFFLRENILEFNFSHKIFKELSLTHKNEMDYFNGYYDFFLFDFIDNKNRTFSSLSHGEKTFFGKIINIYHYVINSEYNNFLFCFDEPEISLHTKWQKIYLKNMIHALEQIEKQICLVFTSHSPFLLSDLPRENVVFLENGKQVNVNINTFGANIHTLLSHGFFMQDGLMGEFAKEKINEAIKYLNQKTLTEKEIDFCENIISIIGEPILKRQLQKMMDSKRLTKIDDIDKKIKDMEYELSVLKRYQSKATNDELKDKAKRKYTKKKKDAK